MTNDPKMPDRMDVAAPVGDTSEDSMAEPRDSVAGEQSIEEYFSAMMQRVQSGVDSARAMYGGPSKETPKSPAEEPAQASQKPAPAPAPKPARKPLSFAPVQAGPGGEKSTDSRPRITETAMERAAMREVAARSTEQALGEYYTGRLVRGAQGKFVLCLIGIVLAFITLEIAPLDGSWTSLVSLTMVVVALLAGFQFMRATTEPSADH